MKQPNINSTIYGYDSDGGMMETKETMETVLMQGSLVNRLEANLDENGEIYIDPDREIVRTTFELRPSTIVGAGKGIFATEDLPSNCWEEYISDFTIEMPKDPTYTWNIYQNEIKDQDIIIGYRDAKRVEHWTKYVNCASSIETQNISHARHGTRIYYCTKTPIKKGEELFIYYGKTYYEYCLSLQEKARKL